MFKYMYIKSAESDVSGSNIPSPIRVQQITRQIPRELFIFISAQLTNSSVRITEQVHGSSSSSTDDDGGGVMTLIKAECSSEATPTGWSLCHHLINNHMHYFHGSAVCSHHEHQACPQYQQSQNLSNVRSVSLVSLFHCNVQTDTLSRKFTVCSFCVRTNQRMKTER